MTQVTLPNAAAQALVTAASDAGLPAPVSQLADATMRQTVITWTPDLSPANLATLTTIQQLAIGSSLLTVAARQALQPDIDGLVTYQGLATPTLAQTAAAVKALSRVVRAILRS